jgi:hypothetical protein
MMLGVGVTILAAGGLPMRGETFTFSFDSLASRQGNTAIQAYMNNVLGGAATVTVTGGALTEQTYNGDGHVVGPCSPANCGPGATVSSVTLGPDTFIRNASGIDSFTFTFSGLLIQSVSFDYEIFPDGTCPNLQNCGGKGNPNLPDFTFSTDLGQVFHYYGQAPAAPGYTHSPNSGRSKVELAPQLIGSGSWNLGGATTLIFTDWPATIAIDNLVINTADAPEPGAVLLLGTLIAIVVWKLRRRKQAA